MVLYPYYNPLDQSDTQAADVFNTTHNQRLGRALPYKLGKYAMPDIDVAGLGSDISWV